MNRVHDYNYLLTFNTKIKICTTITFLKIFLLNLFIYYAKMRSIGKGV